MMHCHRWGWIRFNELVRCLFVLTSLFDIHKCEHQLLECLSQTSSTIQLCPETSQNAIYQSNDIDSCRHWCKSSAAVSHSVIHSVEGRVQISIAPPPRSCSHVRYQVDLMVAEGDSCSGPMVRHSIIHLDDISDQNSTSCTNDIELVFDYVYRGCYQVKMKPYTDTSSARTCQTKPFNISTDHVKTFISDPMVNILTTHNRVEVSHYWNISERGSALFPSTCMEMELHNSSLDHLVPIATCILESNNESLSSAVSDVNCECEWLFITGRDLIEMRCIIRGLGSGTFDLHLRAVDTRCIPYTLWTDSNPTHLSTCTWQSAFNLTSGNETKHVLAERQNIGDIPWWICLAVAILVALTLSSLATVLYLMKSQKVKSRYLDWAAKVESGDCEMYKLVPQRILFLYPRDCQPFMDVMVNLRRLLQSTRLFEVIDPFDEEQMEDVVTNLHTWGLKHIDDPSTKVILAASWCSLKFEEARLDRKSLRYQVSECYDSVFPRLLVHLFHLKDSYRKIYVVRLDCDKCENLHYKFIVQCRNFTLPQSVESLINLLLELPPELKVKLEDDVDNLKEKFRESIENYSKYVQENPDYLTKMLR